MGGRRTRHVAPARSGSIDEITDDDSPVRSCRTRGAAGGIGKAVATCLAAEGACVVVADLHADKARAAAAELGGTDTAVGIGANVSDTGAVDAALDAAALAFGSVDLRQ